MNALLHRLLVLVSGQPDSLATPMAGNLTSKSSCETAYIQTHRITLPYCSGSCHGGRRPCDCPTGSTELACSIPLRPEFPAPKGTAEHDDIRNIFLSSWAATVAATAVCAAILAYWPN